jgi:hypothetical protein
VSRYVASFAARSAAALPREGVSRCPVCDLTCLRIVCRGADCGACADLVLIAVTIALIYGRAAHRRVEHAWVGSIVFLLLGLCFWSLCRL